MASVSSNKFGWQLLGLLTKDKGQDNVFFSPFSISVALAMTRLGARGETAEGMERALCWSADGETIHNEFEEYLELLKTPNQPCVLRTANRIYVEESYPILETFVLKTKQIYLAESVAVDFLKHPEEERQNINTWVEQQTEQKIKDLIPGGVINNTTRMVLVNAIYFKGQWKHKFDAADTRPRLFYTSPSQQGSVQTMQKTKGFPYHKADTYAVLQLPYQGDRISMAIFLPDERFGLQAMERKLTTEEIKTSISNCKMVGDVKVFLPKFEISSTMSMKEMLSQLGMAKAFDADNADFSGMSESKDLYVSEVLHKAFLKVDEEGTEAAAATAVVMACNSFVPFKEDPIKFVADHPFLLIMTDNTNGMILFMGHVTDPQQ